MATFEEIRIFLAPDETHVGNVADELGRIRQGAVLYEVRPELLGELEGLVDFDRAGDIEAAVSLWLGVVQLAKGRVACAGVVPWVGAFTWQLLPEPRQSGFPKWDRDDGAGRREWRS